MSALNIKLSNIPEIIVIAKYNKPVNASAFKINPLRKLIAIKITMYILAFLTSNLITKELSRNSLGNDKYRLLIFTNKNINSSPKNPPNPIAKYPPSALVLSKFEATAGHISNHKKIPIPGHKQLPREGISISPESRTLFRY